MLEGVGVKKEEKGVDQEGVEQEEEEKEEEEEGTANEKDWLQKRRKSNPRCTVKGLKEEGTGSGSELERRGAESEGLPKSGTLANWDALLKRLGLLEG